MTSAAGLVTRYTYDPNLRLESEVRDPQGIAATTTSHYDLAGNLDWVKDPRNYVTDFVYDERNRKSKETGPPISAEGNIRYETQWFYDPASNVRKVILPDNSATHVSEIKSSYDEMNRLSSRTDQMNRPTTMTYWPSGMLKEVKDANDHLTKFEYDERDLKAKVTYPNNTVIQGFEYDRAGNLTKRPTLDSAATQLFGYDERNRLQQMRWSNAIDFSDFSYDGVSRLKTAFNPFSTVTRSYDVAGRLLEEKQALVSTLNVVPSEVTPIAILSRKSHGSAGVFDLPLSLPGSGAVEPRSGGQGGNFTLVLRFAGNVDAVGSATVTSGIGTASPPVASGNEIVVNLAEVSNGQRITVKITGITTGDHSGEVTAALNILFGDLTDDGRVTASDSSKLNQHLGESVSASNYRYDLNLDGVIEGADASALLSAKAAQVPPLASYTVNVTYRYDADGRLQRLFIPGEQVAPYPYDYNRTYDGMGRLEKIFNALDPASHFQYWYDFSSNMTKRRTYLYSGDLRFDPDELGRPRSRTIDAIWFENYPNGRHNYDYSVEAYHYDKMSRLTDTDRTLRSGPASTPDAVTRDSFAYNGAGELTGVKYGQVPDGQGGFGAAAREVSYDLDNMGNRSGLGGVNENGSMTYYEPNELNQYTTVGGESVPTTIQYGPHHELTKLSGATYAYKADGQLSKVTPPTESRATTPYELGYDALGRCVRRSTGGQPLYYIYDGVRVIAEFNPTTSVMAARNIYGNGIDEIVMRDLGYLTFPQQDRLGSTSALLETYGQVVEQYRYDAYGKPQFRSGPTATNPNGTVYINGTRNNNRYLFTGREWAQGYGLYEYRARAYHPTIGRFLQEDPMSFGAGDTNFFRYCGGDPVNRTDALGLKQTPVTAPYKPNEATTPRVVVTPTHDWTGRDNPLGFRDVSAVVGGLGALNQGGGNVNGLGGGGGPRVVSATFKRDSNQLGTTRAQPFAKSTQGWWTTPEGFSTGSSWVMNILVQSAIESGWQASIKSLQSLTFNSLGQIVSHWGLVGSTNFFYLARIPGSANFSASVWSAGGQYLANMTGKAWNVVGNDPIDYSFNFSGSFGGGMPSISGAHDGYPSYTVFANGQPEPLYYRHETGSPFGSNSPLKEPMEIPVGR